MPDFITLSCPSCGSKLQITDDIERFACGHCGNEHIVKRTGGIIALRPVVEGLVKIQAGVDKTASELAILRLEREIPEIVSELARLENATDSAHQRVVQRQHILANSQHANNRLGNNIYEACGILLLLASVPLGITAMSMIGGSVGRLYGEGGMSGFCLPFCLLPVAWTLAIGLAIKWLSNKEKTDQESLSNLDLMQLIKSDSVGLKLYKNYEQKRQSVEQTMILLEQKKSQLAQHRIIVGSSDD